MYTVFRRCLTNKVGWLKDNEQNNVVIDLNGDDVFSCTVEEIAGTALTAAIIHVHYSNSLQGPWVDFQDVQLRIDKNAKTIGLVGQVGRYVRLEVVTAELTEGTIDVHFNSRSSQIDATAIV